MAGRVDCVSVPAFQLLDGNIKVDRFVSRHGADKVFGELVGTEVYILCHLLLGSDIHQREVAVAFRSSVERLGVHRFFHPLLHTGIFCDLVLCAANLVYIICGRVFNPLVVLHHTVEFDAGCSDAESSVDNRIGGRGHCRGVNELAIKFVVDFVNVTDMDGHFLTLFEHPVSFHSAAFVPPQKHRTGGDKKQQNSGSDSNGAVFKPGSISGAFCFGISHNCMI